MDLVKPEVPNAQQNRGPDIFLEGLRGGLSFMAQMSQQRRQAESDAARMALQERLSSREHDLNASKMAQDYELQDRRLSIDEELLGPRKELLDAQAEYHRTTKGSRDRQNANKIATLNDFNRRFTHYGLDNPNPNPVEFYANARKLKDEFEWADIPAIKQTLKGIQMKTKEHTIPLQVNQEVTNDDGETIIRPTTRLVPIGEIIEGIKDPKKFDNVMKTLERSGLMKEDDPSPANKVLREFIQTETKRVESGGGTDFRRSKSRVPAGGVMSDPNAGLSAPTDETIVDDVDESDLFGSIGQTDKYLAQARAALQRGASPKAVAQRLSGFGVDPNQLWAT